MFILINIFASNARLKQWFLYVVKDFVCHKIYTKAIVKCFLRRDVISGASSNLKYKISTKIFEARKY